MGSMGHNHLLGVFVFFITLNTIVVGLRLYVRLWWKKSVFGWDDVFLILTYVRPSHSYIIIPMKSSFKLELGGV